jgi:hypothetical protein
MMSSLPRSLPLLTLLLGFVALPTRAADVAVTGPHAKFSETVFDFGQVPPSAVQRHEFIVTNDGTAPLVIGHVQPGCGCTTVGEWDREIPPGRSGKIPIQFNPQSFNGRVAKAVSVTCNDPAQPNPVLEIRAIVRRVFSVEPGFISFLPVDGEAGRETKIVRIMNTLEAPTTLDVMPPTSPRFATELKTVRPGHEFELHVTYDPAIAGSDLAAPIAIKTSDSGQPMLNLTTLVMPQPAIAVIPPSIQLPSGRLLDGGYRFNLVIRNNGHTPLQVTEPATNLTGAIVRVTAGEAGKLYYVSLSCPEGFKPPTDAMPVLTVKTSHPKFPEIRVPITQAAATTAAAK